MKLKAVSGIMLALLFTGVLIVAFSIASGIVKVSVSPQSSLPVHNINTGLNYSAIQEAIDANETFGGHTILADPGTYTENITVHKSITLTGTNKDNTVIEATPYINVTAHNVTITTFTIRYGVYLKDYNNLTITNIRIVNFIYISIDLVNSNNSIISNNEIYYYAGNETIGILLRYSFFCTIEDNILSGMMGGIAMDYSHNNTVRGNSIVGSPLIPDDVGLAVGRSSDNTFIGNTVKEQSFAGVWILDSLTRNFFFHNNFIDNVMFQVRVHPLSNTTIWDNGYPSGGNYWSDYTGVDVKSGPYQNETGSDGIGDTPYGIEGNNQDNYPLTKPYGGPYDIGITNITTSKTVVGQGYNLSIGIKIVNYGINSEIFGATAYANKTAINQRQITLTSRNSTIITFAWNTTGVPYSNYTITANATIVLGETDTADNTYTDGWVVVTIPGDINGDGTVNILDAIKLAGAFGSKPDDDNWNPNADINSDDSVNILDAIILAGNFGETV
jgi:parallel beta-helix repeat protein